MDSEKLQEAAFEIILSEGNYEEAEVHLNEANDSLVKAHKAQTELLQQYASGEKIEMEIIMVHAQDHLMTTMTLREVAIEMLSLYQKVAQ